MFRQAAGAGTVEPAADGDEAGEGAVAAAADAVAAATYDYLLSMAIW